MSKPFPFTIINNTDVLIYLDWPTPTGDPLSGWTGQCVKCLNNDMTKCSSASCNGLTDKTGRYLIGANATVSGNTADDITLNAYNATGGTSFTFKLSASNLAPTPPISNGYTCTVSGRTVTIAGSPVNPVGVGFQITNNTNMTIQITTPLPPQMTPGWTQSCNSESGKCAPTDPTGTNYIVPLGQVATYQTSTPPIVSFSIETIGPDNMAITDTFSVTSTGSVTTGTTNSGLYSYAVDTQSPFAWSITVGMYPVISVVNFSYETLTLDLNGSQTIKPNSIFKYIDTSGAIVNSTGSPASTLSLTDGNNFTASIAYQSGINPTITQPTTGKYYCPPSRYSKNSNVYSVTFTSRPEPITWDGSTNILTANNVNTVVHGFSLTTTEYQLQGIGMQSFAVLDVSWINGTVDFQTPDYDILDALVVNLSGSTAPSGNVIPAVRIPLNAAYYLGVVTGGWSGNYTRFLASPVSLSQQYINLIDNMVNYFSLRGIVSILDLHWNDDVSTQQPMALMDSIGSSCKTSSGSTLCTTDCCKTGDSLQFWTAIVAKYKTNSYVWYELYNEPYIDPSNPSNWTDIWMNGGEPNGGNQSYYGMNTLYNIVSNSSGMVVIAGALDYAYDYTSLSTFSALPAIASAKNIIYNFHPYLGGAQDASKAPANFSVMIAQAKTLNKPLIITETGQYSCSTNGACGYPGLPNQSLSIFHYDCTKDPFYGLPSVVVGYVEAILQIVEANNISWTLWAWNPATNGTSCPISVNKGYSLNTPSTTEAGWSICGPTGSDGVPGPFLLDGNGCCKSGPCGADYSYLVPKYYGTGPTSAPSIAKIRIKT